MAALTFPALSIRQGECYKQSRERPRFLGRVWCTLSLHLADVYHSCGNGLACSTSLPYIHCSTRRKISLPPRFVEINPCYQGIYPTAVFVVVTMRMSAADILSHPGRDTHHHSSTMIFTPPVTNCPTSYTSYDRWEFIGQRLSCGTREDMSTNILAAEDRRAGCDMIETPLALERALASKSYNTVTKPVSVGLFP
ncbi:hypothetical protein BJV78DRAFT_354093 [Lactifluus subvellereus]|nr:hypothetical protein BJV78DRAFT_354093 [Lactifluus subvellereus]